jgi:hypothetical protein
MTDPATRLHDLLEQAAPGSPELDPASRTAAVVRRGRAARRRDRGLVAGAASAVLAIAVGVPLALGGDDGPAEVAAPPAITAAPCPAEPIDAAWVDPEASLEGVTSVRLCPAFPDPPKGNRPADPIEPLVGEAAEAFAEDVAALPSHGLPGVCAVTIVPLDAWALVAETADGGLVTITAPTRECTAVSIDGTDRGSAEVLAAFAGNLERQQAGDLTPGLDALACPRDGRLADGADTWNASFDIASATAGIICYVADPQGRVEYARTEGKIHPVTLAPIRDDLAARVGPEPGQLSMCVDTGPQRLLVLTDDAGDLAAYVDDRCSGGFTGAQGYWQPSPAAEAAIADALGGPVRVD